MKKDIEQLIEEETEASEAHRDDPLSPTATRRRPNRSRSAVYSIRFDPDEVAELQAWADDAGVPASTLARAWIIERLRGEREGIGDAQAELRAAQRHLTQVQRHLRRDAS